MATIEDGTMLTRLAEDIADRGSHALGDAARDLVEHVTLDVEVLDAIARRIGGDRDRADKWLDGLRAAAVENDDEEYGELVTGLALIGKMIVREANADVDLELAVALA